MDSQAILREILRREVFAHPDSLTRIAGRASIAPSALSEILGGSRGFSLAMFDKIMKALGRELVAGSRPAVHLAGEDRT